jgi:hypothetical protein
MAVVGKMLEHQIEQLHRLRDLGFRHWFERSRSWQRTHPITRGRNPQRDLLRQVNPLHQNHRDDRDLAKAIEDPAPQRAVQTAETDRASRQPLWHRVVIYLLGTFRYLSLRSGQPTRRWRKPDSNSWSRGGAPGVNGRYHLGFAPTISRCRK